MKRAWSSFWNDVMPVEQGSWGLFLIPLAIGIAVGRGNPVGEILLTLCTLSGFLLRRPAMHWLRAFNRESLDAIHTRWPGRAVAFSLILGLGTGLPLVVSRPLLVGIFGIGTALVLSEVYLESLHKTYSLISELSQVWTLCLLAPAATYVATNRLDATGILLWALCAVYFTITVADIRVRVSRLRVVRGTATEAEMNARKAERLLTIWVGIAAVIILGVLEPQSARALWALAPLLARPFRRRALTVAHLTQVRSIGWSEVFFSVCFGLLLVLLV
jgi:hypothetical protein